MRESAKLAMSFIFALEVLALFMGKNGVALAASIGAIAGLGGYRIGLNKPIPE